MAIQIKMIYIIYQGMKLPTCNVADVPSGEQFADIINCNIMSMARLTNLLLPAMRKQKRGLIINIGSVVGTGFAPMRATYGASKVIQHSIINRSYTI
jgi:17beta-estradiol 17-dehydrogenase / very-long-chain 3-oxoacyl-CoA reductase